MTGSQSLERGLNILKILSDDPDPLGVREIARRCSLSAAVIQRLMNTLGDWGYVEQDPATKRYRLGHAALALAHHVIRQGPMLEAALVELRQLARDHHLNGFLGVRRGGRGIYLIAVQSDGPLVVRATPGDPLALHSTALGKALLAALDDAQVLQILGSEPLEAKTARTVTDPERLLAQLRKARMAGHATSVEENLPGIVSVGAGICDAAGTVVAAISVAYPRALEPSLTTTIVAPLVMAAAARISFRLGFRGPSTPHA
ncbi:MULTISPECIES: IclR family transcriptional regulator [unclassified Chelatococcus]|uniref:IclR family transcriptional regulator n=1 Tax=unclassified Chelatococcus TaxID=2638111 RepID=UPI00031A1A23|nr:MULTISPECIES: IclR family transcriptional regulator [unclassified Chelatococcus]ALA18511.1 IclR family transcriptional regulator [Chelatococcus sp. CO-6]